MVPFKYLLSIPRLDRPMYGISSMLSSRAVAFSASRAAGGVGERPRSPEWPVTKVACRESLVFEW